jgi:EmrB/QacA subfamily drug resistance transporter
MLNASVTQTFRAMRRPFPQVPRHENRWAALTAMAISTGVTSIPTSVVAIAIPKIHQEFNASTGELQWMLVGFSLSYSALMIVAGRLSDIFGRKLFFLTGTVVYIAGALFASLAQSSVTLIIAIVVVGAGAAILTPASLSIITDAFEPEQRGTAIGIWAAAGVLVTGVGPAFGGILADWNWRSVFWINIPFCVVFFALTVIAGRESKDPHADRHIDYAGLGTLAGGLTAISLFLNQGQEWGFTSTKSLILLIAAVVLFAVFAVVERRARNPLVDFGFFRKRNYAGANVALLAANFILAAIMFFLPLYLVELLHYSTSKAGVLMLPMSATMIVLLPLGGPISERVGPRIPIAAGLLLSALGGYLFTLVDANSGYNEIWPAMLVIGAGVGLCLTPINTAAMNAIRRAEHGAAAGVLVTMSGLGMIFGVAVSGALFQQVKDQKTDELLAKVGVHLSEATERTLEGLLAGAHTANHALHRYSQSIQSAIEHAVRQGFTDAFGAVMWLSLAVCVAGVVAVLLVMQRSAPIPDEEEEVTGARRQSRHAPSSEGETSSPPRAPSS